MLIVCPNCTTSYEIDAGTLGAGRSVRCARCRNTWMAVPSELAVAEAHSSLAVLAAIGGSVRREEEAAAAHLDAGAGEWLTTAEGAAPGFADPAESAVTIESPSLVPVEPAAYETGQPEIIEQDSAAATRNGDIETVAAIRRAPVARISRRRSPLRLNLPFVILALMTVVAALIGWRAAIVRAAPQSARLYAAIGLPVNLRGLAIEDVKTTEETQDNVPVLVVEGTIVNVANRTVDVPRLRFAVRNPAGIEIYAWTALPNQPLLARGEKLAFRSRLASPPADTHDIVVRFFHRRDLETAR